MALQGGKKHWPWSPMDWAPCQALTLAACVILIRGFPCISGVKNSPPKVGDAGDVGSIPRTGRSPGGGHGNSLQYSCLENSIDRGAWWATVHGVAKSWTRLSTQHATLFEFLAPSPLYNGIIMAQDSGFLPSNMSYSTFSPCSAWCMLSAPNH